MTCAHDGIVVGVRTRLIIVCIHIFYTQGPHFLSRGGGVLYSGARLSPFNASDCGRDPSAQSPDRTWTIIRPSQPKRVWSIFIYFFILLRTFTDFPRVSNALTPTCILTCNTLGRIRRVSTYTYTDVVVVVVVVIIKRVSQTRYHRRDFFYSLSTRHYTIGAKKM